MKQCLPFDTNLDYQVHIDELTGGVLNAIIGCEQNGNGRGAS